MSKKYQSGFIRRQKTPSGYPETMYKSLFYIKQAHTHLTPRENLNRYSRLNDEKIHTTRQQINNLYLDPQTGIM